MNAVAILILIALVWCLARAAIRFFRAHRHRGHARLRSSRFLHRRRRQRATVQARELARAAIAGHVDATAHLGTGVILEPAEQAWGRAPARLAVRTSQAAWTAYGQASWLGRRTRNVTRETSTERWQDRGNIDWLITSQRAVGRLPAAGEMISLWWGSLAGLDIDLKKGRIVLNGVNGWTGILVGASLAPIAVVGVAACHGLEALLVHPALEKIRGQGPIEPPQGDGPEAVGSGATIIRLPTPRRPA